MNKTFSPPLPLLGPAKVQAHADTNGVPPAAKPSRVSVPVSAEVLDAFQRLGKASNMSTGKAMAEWLADTVEAVEYMAVTMEKARSSPKEVIREMHAYALGLSDETGELMRTIARKGEADRESRRAQAGRGKRSDAPGLVPEAPKSDAPRLVIRGGNSSTRAHKANKVTP